MIRPSPCPSCAGNAGSAAEAANKPPNTRGAALANNALPLLESVGTGPQPAGFVNAAGELTCGLGHTAGNHIWWQLPYQAGIPAACRGTWGHLVLTVLTPGLTGDSLVSGHQDRAVSQEGAGNEEHRQTSKLPFGAINGIKVQSYNK